MQRWTRQYLDERFRPVRAAWEGHQHTFTLTMHQPQHPSFWVGHAGSVRLIGRDGHPIVFVFPRDLPAYLAAWSNDVLMAGLLPSDQSPR